MEYIVKNMKTFRLLLFSIVAVIDSCHSQSTESNIILINTGPYDKGRIAKLISIVDSLNPKVISLDIAFPEYNGSRDDLNLYHALENCKRLVMASTIYPLYEDKVSIAMASVGEFSPLHAKTGFVSAKVDKDQILIPNQFIVQQEDFNGDIEYHFSVRTAMSFDSLKTIFFVKKNPKTADVNYKNRKRKFKIFSASEVLNGKLTRNDIEGKIVMLGFLGPGDQDKFYTPLNTNPHEPDMYGLEYLANIVAQVLESK